MPLWPETFLFMKGKPPRIQKLHDHLLATVVACARQRKDIFKPSLRDRKYIIVIGDVREGDRRRCMAVDFFAALALLALWQGRAVVTIEFLEALACVETEALQRLGIPH